MSRNAMSFQRRLVSKLSPWTFTKGIPRLSLQHEGMDCRAQSMGGSLYLVMRAYVLRLVTCFKGIGMCLHSLLINLMGLFTFLLCSNWM